MVAVQKPESSTEEFFLGKILIPGTTRPKLDWLTIDNDGIWSEGKYGEEKVAKKDILAKIKGWTGNGQMPDKLRNELRALYLS